MKLSLQELKLHVTKPLSSLYLVSGDETLLVQETVDLLRKSAGAQGFSERVRIPTDSGSDWANLLYANAQSLSLLAERRILELDLRGIKLNQATSEIVQTLAERPPADTVLILTIHKLDTKATQSKWVKAIEKNGVLITIWPVSPEQLPQWIVQRAREAGLTLNPGAAARLAARVEGNLLAAAQEIEKLCLLQPEGTLDEKTLETLITDHTHFDIFNLVDSVLSGNGKRSLQILQALFAEQIEPVLMLWALTRELNTMADIQRQLQTGASLSTLFGQFRIWEKRQAPVRAFLKRATISDCQDFLLQAAQMDRIIKGIEVGQIRESLERLVLAMAGVII